MILLLLYNTKNLFTSRIFKIICYSLYILIMIKPNHIHFNLSFSRKIYFKYMTNFYRTFSFRPPMKQIRHMHNSHIKTRMPVKFFIIWKLWEKPSLLSEKPFYRLAQNDPVSHKQKDLDLLTIIFRSVLHQFSLVDNPDISELLNLSQFRQYFFKDYYIVQTASAISKYKTILSNYPSSLEPFHEISDFQSSAKNPPPTPISQCRDLTLCTKQEIDERLGTLLSADQDFFPLTRRTAFKVPQSTPDTPVQVAKTL